MRKRSMPSVRRSISLRLQGTDCTSLTEELNKVLGEVYEVKPTEEMFQQKVEVDVGVENSVSESWGNGGDSSGGGGNSW